MKCPNCGKEIRDTDNYCQYCGKSVKMEKKMHKRWGLRICILLGLVVLVGGVALAMKTGKSDEKEEKQEDKKIEEVQKEEDGGEKVEESIEKEEIEKEVTLDDMSKNGIANLIEILGNVDCKMDGIQKEQSETYKGYSFLFMSLYKRIPFLDGAEVEMQSGDMYAWKIPEKEVVRYLENSIGSKEYLEEREDFKVINGMVCVGAYDPGSMWTVCAPSIRTISAISEDKIRIEGDITYEETEGAKIEKDFSVVLRKNPESIWGGYTLDDVEKWVEVSNYLLPDAAIRIYTEEELERMDANQLYLARNEIYARHGYIFKNEELRAYFESMSWYHPTVTEVSDEELNLYEKANIKLIQEKEEAR